MSGYKSPDNKLYYQRAYKNATTSMQALLEGELGWIEWPHVPRPAPAPCFVLVREPLERYLSGVMWYWRVSRVAQGVKPDPEPFYAEVTHNPAHQWDAHTMRQSEYFNAWDGGPDIYIAIDDNLDEHLSLVLGQEVQLSRLNSKSDAHSNAAYDYVGDPSTYADELRSRMGPENFRSISEYYEEDYKIWNRVCDAGGLLRGKLKL